ncbi:MAG: hypothetical protein PVI75_04735 [Gammaproteobacteria bacterium]|jgi:hypothetical protein
MAVIDLYSKRQKRLSSNQPEVYTYNEMPQKFRIQIKQIISDCYHHNEEEYKKAVISLRKEYGKELLADGSIGGYLDYHYSFQEELFEFFKNKADYEQCLDVIELMFKYINKSYKPNKQKYIDELNIRFKENGLGYRFENNQIIRIDNELLHSKVVKPALQLLFHPDYKNANEEFLKAYDNYKKGDLQEANTHCRRAFESTMKIICDKHGYNYNNDSDNVKKLLKILKDSKFFPAFTEDHLNNLVGLLQGIGTVSNKKGAHGKGSNNEPTPPHYTGYLLHMTASAILFFSEIEKIEATNDQNSRST